MKTFIFILFLVLSLSAFAADVGDLSEVGFVASGSSTYSQVKKAVIQYHDGSFKVELQKDTIILSDDDYAIYYSFDEDDYLTSCSYFFRTDPAQYFVFFFNSFSDNYGRPGCKTDDREDGVDVDFWWDDRMISIGYFGQENFLMVKRFFNRMKTLPTVNIESST